METIGTIFGVLLVAGVIYFAYKFVQNSKTKRTSRGLSGTSTTDLKEKDNDKIQ